MPLSFLRTLCLTMLCASSLAMADSHLRWDASGLNGSNARPGSSVPGTGMDGNKGYAGFRGGDGQRGSDGRDALDAQNGQNGGTISIRLELDPKNPARLLFTGHVNGRSVSGSLDLNEKTQIQLLARGGNGGNGAAGGDGQNGGRGGEGGDADRFQQRSGDGGRGGDGGNAGRSANGANGGDGGTIVIQIPQDQVDLASRIQTDVSGGSGGIAPPFSARPGRGGSGGQPGNQCFWGDSYQCGIRGMIGMNGMDGHPMWQNPVGGVPGVTGRVAVEFLE